MFINDNLVCFKSKLIKDIKKSTCLSEAFALELGFTDLKFILNLFTDLKIKLHNKPVIKSDSLGLIQFVKKTSSTKNIRSWEFKFHQMKAEIRELCEIEHVEGENNYADILTKVLPTTRFQKLRKRFFEEAPKA